MDKRLVAGGLVALAAALITFGPRLAQPKPAGADAEEAEDVDDDDDADGASAGGPAPTTVRFEPLAPTGGVPPLASRAAAPAGAPNVVLVFGCTVRKDQLGIHGGPDTMPWLSRLAADGVVFDDALSVSSWTRASAVGVLTGHHPLSFGLPEPGPRQSERVLADTADLLAEQLQRAGWETFGGTANPNLNRRYGMAQGMDHYRDTEEKAFRDNRITGDQLVRESLATLDARADRQRPFYLQLMLIDAHHPRNPPPDRLERFRRPDVPPQLARYRASLTQLDDALAALDQGLATRGYTEDNTLFVFVTDHGEGLNLPAHHGPGHGKQMYPTTVGISWVVRGPTVRRGERVRGLASGVDVSPTVLGALGLPVPASAGLDLSAWLQGEQAGPTPRSRAFAYSMFHRADVGSVWTAERQCQQRFEHDLDGIVVGCFDRQADPDFAHPFIDDSLMGELNTWRAERIAEGAGLTVETTTVTDRLMQQLEALGYVDE